MKDENIKIEENIDVDNNEIKSIDMEEKVENIIPKKRKEKKDKLNKKTNSSNHTVVVLIVSILLSFICGMVGAYLIVETVSVSSVVKNITTSELVETSISTSIDKVYKSTVVVISSAKGSQVSTGTGFIYKIENKKAYILTNNHVVDSADAVEVEFNGSTARTKAQIVGKEVYSDIAVLTIEATDDMEAVEIGDSEKANLGDTIFTVGSPMGIDYKGTVTKGIISGKNRLVGVNLTGSTSDYYMKVIQIDAAVNPGNSGGPLCDVSGNVIGIISLKIVQNEVEGMGFAIPIEDALKYAEALETGKTITRPYIGISMMDLTSEYALWQYKIQIPEDVTKGIAIVEVVSGSPADKAGLQKGDIIIELAGVETASLADFRYELYKHEVGDKVSMKYYRDGKIKDVTIALGKSK